MYSDEQLLPLSAVGQYIYCPRRFALLHIEQQWEDNLFTAEGTVLHEKADSGVKESRGSIRITRSMRLNSYELGVTGIADIVEFHRVGLDEIGITLPNVVGRWMPFPVEYKRGAAKDQEGYKAQLCLQGICLEEMLKIPVPSGALFFWEKNTGLKLSSHHILGIKLLLPAMLCKVFSLQARRHHLNLVNGVARVLLLRSVDRNLSPRPARFTLGSNKKWNLIFQTLNCLPNKYMPQKEL